MTGLIKPEYNGFMKQRRINFVTLLKGYKNGWVAISNDFKRVIFYGKSLKDVMAKAKNIKEKLYYFPAERSFGDFVGENKRLFLIVDFRI